MENPYTSRQPYGAPQKAASILARSTQGHGTNTPFTTYNYSAQNFNGWGNFRHQNVARQTQAGYNTHVAPTSPAPKTPYKRVLKGVEYIIRKGSITNYATDTGAIVNAANEQGLGGGGVDGAISRAGGNNLSIARSDLPCIWNNVRVRTGDARVTEPV